MEGLPSGDIQAKYQKLASEYSKLRAHIKVLKKGVLDEQAKSNELRDLLKEKEKAYRKGELEIDSLNFRNQQLTRRVSVLQEELDILQQKQNKKLKNKSDDKQIPSTSANVTLDCGLLKEELQKKIIENAEYASQLSDRVFEISQLKLSLEDYQRIMNENDNKYKCEIARLKNKNQELQFALEEAMKERNSGTPNKMQLPSGNQLASCNGDFVSEGGSLIGSEDALSSADYNVNEQLCTKMQLLEQENQTLQMEIELLQMENDSLKLEVSKHASASQKRTKSEGHDSGDFNQWGAAAADGEGRLVGLLGVLAAPLALCDEHQAREHRLQQYFRKKLLELALEKELLDSKTEHYVTECERLRTRLELAEEERAAATAALAHKHDTIGRLEEELQSTAHNYEQQLGVLSEHVAALSEQLAHQHDTAQRLQHQLRKK